MVAIRDIPIVILLASIFVATNAKADAEDDDRKRNIALYIYRENYPEQKVLDMVDELYNSMLGSPDMNTKAKELIKADKKGIFAYSVDVTIYSYAKCAGEILYKYSPNDPEVDKLGKTINECRAKKFSYFLQTTNIAKYALNMSDPHVSSCWLKNRNLRDEIDFPVKPELLKLVGDPPDPMVSWRVDFQKLVECIQQ